MLEDYKGKQNHRRQQGNSEREEKNLRTIECLETAAPSENEGRTEQEKRKLWQNKLEYTHGVRTECKHSYAICYYLWVPVYSFLD